jgi:excisionase family DNA binding protein
MDRLLNIRESAELLRLSPNTLRAWIFQKRMPFVRLGRRILLREKDLQTLVDEGFQDRNVSHKRLGN